MTPPSVGARIVAVAVVVAMGLTPGLATAQQDGTAGTALRAPAGPIERAVSQYRWAERNGTRPAPRQAPLRQTTQRALAPWEVGMVMGATIGVIAGWGIAAQLHRHDPDPESAGAVGIPIGAVIGGALGAWIGSR
jgi:hypothetical protein